MATPYSAWLSVKLEFLTVAFLLTFNAPPFSAAVFPVNSQSLTLPHLRYSAPAFSAALLLMNLEVETVLFSLNR